MNFRFWRRSPPAPARFEAEPRQFDVSRPEVIATAADARAYRAWADAQVCRGCDTPGCGPGCGEKATAKTGMWVTEVCCWRCHFHQPYAPEQHGSVR